LGLYALIKLRHEELFLRLQVGVQGLYLTYELLEAGLAVLNLCLFVLDLDERLEGFKVAEFLESTWELLNDDLVDDFSALSLGTDQLIGYFVKMEEEFVFLVDLLELTVLDEDRSH
jgi:hypothetical protein